MLDAELLKILACPDCKSELKMVKNSLKCAKCGRVYQIRNGIPILLPKHQ